MPTVATEMFFIYYNRSQLVSAPTGHLQVEQNICQLSMVPSIPQRIRCFAIFYTCGANYSILILQFSLEC
jgi:hypothetical protein